MIYDCFTFFNELDLLEIRLNILNDVVDRFVLVEATKSFTLIDKELIFEKNKQRFAKFLHKIDHVVVDKYPRYVGFFKKPTAWDYETNQRNAILQGLERCKRNDIVLISDIDEIPKPEKILEYKDRPGFKIFEQRLYYYYLNCLAIDSNSPLLCPDGSRAWNGTIMTHYKNLSTPQKVRNLRDRSARRNRMKVPDSGWHYSWLGGTEKVVQKVLSFSHTELLTSEEVSSPKRIEAALKSGKEIFGRTNITLKTEKLEDHAPEYILHNKEMYQHLVLQ